MTFFVLLKLKKMPETLAIKGKIVYYYKVANGYIYGFF